MPSPEYLQLIRARMELYDELPEEQAALIGEYGWERVERAARRFYGRWQQCREFLETERQRNEAIRWANGGCLPPGL